MPRTNKLIAFTLIFLSIFNIILPFDFESIISYGNTGDILYILYSAYFEFWQDPTTKEWLYDASFGGGRHSFGGPSSSLSSYNFPSVSVQTNYKVKSIETYSPSRSYPGLQNQSGINLSEIGQYMVRNYSLNNAQQHVGASGTVNINASFTTLNKGSSKSRQEGIVTVFTNYVPIVITLEPDRLDTVTAKYVDTSGKSIRNNQNYTPTKTGYFIVDAPTITGYTLTNPPVGKHDVYIGTNGTRHEVTFTYKSSLPNPPPSDPPPPVNPTGSAAIRVAEKGSSSYRTSFTIPSGQNSIDLDLVNLSSSNVNNLGYYITNGLGGVKTTYSVNERVTSSYSEGTYTAVISFVSTSGGIYSDYTTFTVGKGSGGSPDPEPDLGMPSIRVDASPREVQQGEIVHLDVSKREDGSTYRITDYHSWSISGHDSGNGRLPSSIDTSHLSGGTYEVVQTAEVENGGLINGSDTFRVIELEPPRVRLSAIINPVNRGDYQEFSQLNNAGEDGIFPVTNRYWTIVDGLNRVADSGSGYIPQNYFVELEEGNYEAFQYIEYENLGRYETVYDSDTFQVIEHVDFRPVPQIQKAGANVNLYQEMTLVGNDTVSWFIRQKGIGTYVPLDLNTGDYGSAGAFTIDRDSISEPIEYEIKLVLNKSNGQKKEAVQAAKFLNNPSIDFNLVPEETFVDDYVFFEDLRKNVELKNISLGIRKGGDPEQSLILNSNNEFTRSASGYYTISRKADNYTIGKATGSQYSSNRDRFPKEPSRLEGYRRLPGVSDKEVWIPDRFEIIPNSTVWTANTHGSGIREYSFWYIMNDDLKIEKLINFLDDIPIATFNTYVATGYKDSINPTMESYSGEKRGKMYKQITLDGSPSVDKTDTKIQEKYPIDFSHEQTRFIIEPLTGRYGTVDTSKLPYVLGQGREVIGNAVVFKGKKMQDIRIDKYGWYRIKYQVYNGRHVSEFDEDHYNNVQYIEVKPEINPQVNIEIPYKTVYRDTANSLKSEIILDVSYVSVDDDIDLDSLKVSLAYDNNNDGNFTNDGVHSNQYFYLTKTNETGRKQVQAYITNIKVTDLSSTSKRVTLTIDNANKNHLGNFKFEFEAIEKLKIPNLNNLGNVPLVSATTQYTPSVQKISEIDNVRPKIEMEGLIQEGTTEVWLLEVGGTSFTNTQIQQFVNNLKSNKISPVVYLIKRDGIIERYITNDLGILQKIN